MRNVWQVDIKMLFSGLDSFSDEPYGIILKDHRPYQMFTLTRCVPIALQSKFIETLDELERERTKVCLKRVSKVNKPTDWVTKFVIIEKPVSIRLCLDPKDHNSIIKREHYQIPSADDINLTRYLFGILVIPHTVLVLPLPLKFF